MEPIKLIDIVREEMVGKRLKVRMHFSSLLPKLARS